MDSDEIDQYLADMEASGMLEQRPSEIFLPIMELNPRSEVER
jgi:hypothetical protein